MKRQNKSVWSLRNQMIVALLAQAIFTVLFAVVFGGMGIFYLFAQSFIAIFLVENANYVVHYGLLRKELSRGVPGPLPLDSRSLRGKTARRKEWHHLRRHRGATNFDGVLQPHPEEHRPGSPCAHAASEGLRGPLLRRRVV